jgi:tRNA threonylcarbamoyladenosine biosynthesis protein TsaE
LGHNTAGFKPDVQLLLDIQRRADSLLLEEFLESPGCLAIEWPENLGDRLPSGAWHLDFAAPDERTRVITRRPQ